MHNQRMPQTQVIRADKRLEVLVREQEREHQHVIAAHNKEMQSMRDSLNLAIEKFKAISEKNDQDIKEFKVHANSIICALNDKVMTNACIIAEQWKTIQDLHEQLQSFQVIHATKGDIERIKKDVQSQMQEGSNAHLVSLQNCQRDCKALFTVLQDEFAKMVAEVREKIGDAMNKGEANYSLAKLDKEGIEREIIRYKKAAFYTEKKIENIYTLIERLNKKLVTCPI